MARQYMLHSEALSLESFGEWQIPKLWWFWNALAVKETIETVSSVKQKRQPQAAAFSFLTQCGTIPLSICLPSIPQPTLPA